MRIKIADIVKINGASVKVEYSAPISTLGENGSEYFFAEPIEFLGQITNINGMLTLSGKLIAKFSVNCYRCLKEFSGTIEVDVLENYMPVGKGSGEESYFYEGNYLEIDQALLENVILGLPMKSLCEPLCKGLCHTCGIDLNEGQCSCDGILKEQSRFSGLQDLVFEEPK